MNRKISGDGMRFLTTVSFHDAKLVDVRSGEKYGRKCLLLLIDFRTTGTLPADGKVYEVTLLDGIFMQEPKQKKDCFILALDCDIVEHRRIWIELEYFSGEEARHDSMEIAFSAVEVRKVK